jgi:hypothetical protein
MNKVTLSAAGVWFGLLCFCASLALSACGTAPDSTGASPAEARAAAQEALARMDEGQSAPVGGAQAAAAQSSAQAAVRSGARPAWVDSVESVYNKGLYIAAVGYAADRALAEKNAFANLAAIFGQSVQADQKITSAYQEMVKNGAAANWSDSTVLESTITTSASLDNLVGAEIRDVWFDNKSTYYAAAVMDKAKTAQLYNDLIQANQMMIANLVTMDQSEKNSLEGYSRYQFAAVAADMNIHYGNLLRVIDAAPPAGLRKGDEYRLEAANISRAIPVGVTVKNDRAGRIQGAFARALADLGFRSGRTNSRYRVEADIDLSETQFPNQQNIFVRYTLSANFVDTAGGEVLAPYTITDREGHVSLVEAENRAITAMERKINAEYAALLSDRLLLRLPEK